MPKRVLALILVLIFTLAALSGCGAKISGDTGNPSSQGGPPSNTNKPTIDPQGGSADNTPDSTPDIGETPGVSSPGGATPSDSYSRYIDMKTKAYERISAKINEHEELVLSAGMSLVSVGLVDMALLPLTIISLGSGAGAALGMFGYENVNIEQNGSMYAITYTDKEGIAVKQTCEYDAGTDSMRSAISQGGTETIYFEHVRVGDGYASQYLMYDQDSGEYSLIKSYFNDTNIVGFGLGSATGKPPSDLVKNT